MKRTTLYIVSLAVALLSLASCSDEGITGDTIFPTTSPTRSAFDQWILDNFTYPYNVEVTYKLDDTETDMAYTVVPADSAKAAKLIKLVKYMWYDAYDEVVGKEFLKQYSPRMIMLVGSGMYDQKGTVTLGYATGSIKVGLCYVNNLTDSDLRDIETLNDYYLSTLHHEFTHILNQKVDYDKAFEQITEGTYVSGNWYLKDNSEAYSKGYVRNYAMNEPAEDFAETCADYIVYSDTKWASIMASAKKCYNCDGAGKVVVGIDEETNSYIYETCSVCVGTGESDGDVKIEEKVEFIRNYLLDSFGLDIDALREVVQRRASEIKYLDLNNL